MVTFVNREAERELIEDSLRALDNYRNILLRTPIINFYGIDGIGKTAIMQHIEEMCQKGNTHYIRVSANKNAQDFSRSIIQQAKRYNISFDEHYDEYLLQQSITTIKDLLKQGAVVMLLDTVDTTNQELVDRIANTLREVIDENKLFVVLTSKKVLSFEAERAVGRKLTSIALKPFDQKGCDDYLDTIGIPLDPGVRNYIYDWTQGYPLAIEVMTDAIVKQSLDPRLEADRQPLMALIFQHVIEERVLAHLKPLIREKYNVTLLLLSIPRRFNVVIMQELVERFEPALKRESSTAYINLSQELIRETGILSWNMLKAGFSINTPIRRIYLLKNKIEREEWYLEVHRFLAELNKKLADKLTGTDHIWYIREALYHSAFTTPPVEMAHILEQSIQQIINDSSVLFEQFYEEFLQDKEFQEQLGREQTLSVLSLFYRHRAQVNLQSARATTDTERPYHLRELFYYTVKDPHISDQRTVLNQLLHDLIEEDAQVFSPQLFAELAQDEQFKAALGQYAALFASLVQEILAEGK